MTLGAALVLIWARLSRTPWREIGYVRPARWIGSLVLGIVFGSAFKVLMKAIVMPLLGADPINHAYHYLAENQAAIPATLYALIIGAGFGEGNRVPRVHVRTFAPALRIGCPRKVSTVLVTSVLFGLAHYSVQGLAGPNRPSLLGSSLARSSQSQARFGC